MRKPMQRVTRQQTSRVGSIPAPVGGWNARDSLAQMPDTDAPLLINFWPTPSDVITRKGYSAWATGIAGNVWTLADYAPENSDIKLFAAAGGAIYDVTASGAVAAPVVTGLASDYWQHVQFSTPGGSFLYMVNGADKPRVFNGTTWTAIDASSTPAITGVNTTDLTHINAFKQRLFFIEKNSMNAWYLPVQSIGGIASKLDFTSVFRNGGHLVAMGTWSLDGGYGMDDYAAWVTSRGEIAVYRGTDPSSSDSWSIVGVYEMGSPMGARCLMKFGPDLLYIGKDGVSPMSKCLQSTRVDAKSNVTSKIQYAISAATGTFDSERGWELCSYPLDNMLVLNVPNPDAHEQYVMNTITGAWAQFQGWNANCFEIFSDRLFFGADGAVYRAWHTFADNGAAIKTDAVQSFSYFGDRQNKQFVACRPIINTNGGVGISLGINTDFDVSQFLSNPTFGQSGAALWDLSLWDVALWGNDGEQKRDWQYVGGIGIAASLHIKTTSVGSMMRWSSTDYLYIPAGVI